ncbi:MAG: hypothetical protein ABGF52_11270 [Candidatus Asgardarchaeum sp.]
MVRLSDYCPLCKKRITIYVDENLIKESTHYPVTIVSNDISLIGKPHRHLMYVDANLQSRGISPAFLGLPIIVDFKYLEPEDNVKEGVFFEVIDLDEKIVDARLLAPLSPQELTNLGIEKAILQKILTLSSLGKYYSLIALSKDTDQIIDLEFSFSILEKKVKKKIKIEGLFLHLIGVKNRVALFASVEKISINKNSVASLLRSYRKDVPTEALKVAVKYVLESDIVYPEYVDLIFKWNYRISSINMSALINNYYVPPRLLPIVNKMVTFLKEPENWNLPIGEVISRISAKPLEFIKFLFYLSTFNLVELQGD